MIKGKKGGIKMAVTKWQCTRCGKIVTSPSVPLGRTGGNCPDTSSGNHIWVKMG